MCLELICCHLMITDMNFSPLRDIFSSLFPEVLGIKAEYA